MARGGVYRMRWPAENWARRCAQRNSGGDGGGAAQHDDGNRDARRRNSEWKEAARDGTDGAEFVSHSNETTEVNFATERCRARPNSRPPHEFPAPLQSSHNDRSAHP